MSRVRNVVLGGFISIGIVVLLSGRVFADQPVFQKMDGPDQDGKVTADEMKARHAAWFTELDADGNGAVVVEEFQSCRFMEMDGPDNDEIITEEEFVIFFLGPDSLETYTAATASEYPETAFMVGTMDKDGDGCVVIEEFIPAVKARFQHMDENKDSQISKDEFAAFRKLMMEKHDADASGHLTPEELHPE